MAEPNIAVDSSNNLHVVWAVGGCGACVPKLYYSKYSGTSWSTPIIIGNTSAAWRASIVVDSLNNLHVLWANTTGGAGGGSWDGIYYTKYNGSSWSSPVKVTTGYDLVVSVAIDSTNSLHISFIRAPSATPNCDIDNCEIYYSKYSGSSWSTPINISNTSSPSLNSNISVDSNNNVYIVWQDKSPGNFDIFYSKYNGTFWSTPVNISNSSAISAWPSLPIRTASSGVDVIWTEGDAAPYSVMYSRLPN